MGCEASQCNKTSTPQKRKRNIPTEKDIALCLCKLCLNIILLMKPLMSKTKGLCLQVCHQFFMSSCICEKEIYKSLLQMEMCESEMETV